MSAGTPASTAVSASSRQATRAPDAVRREQRVGAPAAARLAAPERVGALERRRQRRRPGRRPRPRAASRRKPAERHLHGVLDVVAHRPAERAGVRRDLVGDRCDGVRGDLGQAARGAGRAAAGRG